MTAIDSRPAVRLAEWYSLLRRHLGLAAAVGLAVFASASVYILRMPDVYQAETRILVNPQRVSDKYVSSTVSMGSNERLNTLSQQVLSSTRLESIVEELNLFPALRRTLGQEQMLDTMRHHIAIELKQSSDGPSSFTITYTGGSAKEVAAVTNRLAASFIGWNLRDREQEAQGTTEFLSKELAVTKTQLDGFEEQLRTYKLQHLGELPDQLQANMQALSRLQVQLQANIDAQSRLDHEAFLAKAEPEAIANAGLGASAGGASPRQQLLARDAEAHRELAELRARYTPEFPDVVSKQAEVRALDLQAGRLSAPEPAVESRSGVATESPAAATVFAGDPRLQLLARDRTRLDHEQRQIEAEINGYQARVNAEPIREQEIAQVLRDYDTAKEHYRSLLEKTYSAQMATELERRQEGGSFTMLDPARVPDAPVGPNRVALLAGCFLFSLGIGASTGVIRELLDGSVKSEAELRDLVPGAPMLGIIPRIGAASGPRPGFYSAWGSTWSKR